MKFDYQEVAEILESNNRNESENPGMRNFSTDIRPGPEVIGELLEKGYIISSIEPDSGVSSSKHRIWISTHEEACERWDIHIAKDENVLEEEIEQEADELLQEMEPQKQPNPDIDGPSVIYYKCNDCANSFSIENVVDYEGCPQCRSRDTERQ